MTPELAAFIKFLARIAVEQYLAECQQQSSSADTAPESDTEEHINHNKLKEA